MTLTQETVRTAMLAAQGLLSPPQKPATKSDILPIINRMGYLQIDTIQAVRRSQNLVLWSRLGDYDVDWLDQLHVEGHLFEYYAHALCYLPIEDYPLFRGMILYDERTGNGWQKWADQHPEVIQQVLSIVREKGHVSSMDFESETISTGWGAAKHEKIALNRLFTLGELMVSHRDTFRRYYDLRERVLPEWDDANALDVETGHQLILLKTIRALGVAREDWVAPYYYRLKTGLPAVLAGLVAEGKLHQTAVDGWDAPVYIHPGNLATVEAAAAGDLMPTYTTLLSPFDPLVSDRDRALALFDFDYRMESYTPVKDRKYGYFCLPILHKGRLVGRLDPKAHRKEKRMEIKKVYLEPGVKSDEDLVGALRETLTKFTAWHEMESLEIKETEPAELREALG
jgi:hypothetical protein